MATVTPGITFVSGETVTPAKLNSAATPTISAIQTADISDSQITTAKIADGAVTQSKLNSSVTLVPVGAVMPFAMNSAPTGWLAADGSTINRTTYSALFSAIGTTYGAGDGSTTFSLPDLRGIFVRGSGSQTISGTTYNKTFAAKEQDAFQGHFHNVEVINTASLVGLQANSGGAGAVGAAVPVGTTSGDANDNLIRAETIVSDGINGTPRIESETRPANIALLYCIKF